MLNHVKAIVLVSSLGAALAGSFYGCAGDTVYDGDPAVARSEAELSSADGLLAHVLTNVQTRILHTYGTFAVVAGQRTTHLDAVTCTKAVTQGYHVTFVTQGVSTAGAAVVTCTGTCHGNSCSPRGCNPDGNGECTQDVSCSGEGCTDASCGRSSSVDNGLAGGIAQVQSAGG
jgi:hypothetical protein